MSSSEDYFRGLVRGQSPGDWAAAVRTIVADFGKGASRWLADAGGVSTIRSPERWIAKAGETGSQASTPKPMTQVSIVEAVKRYLAAKHVRQSSTAHAGKVDVKYPEAGRSEGTRDIGDVEIDATSLEECARAVEGGDYEEAGELLNAAVLEAYGVPEGVLEIADYQDGVYLD